MKNYKILTVTPFFPPDLGGIADMVLNLNTNLIKQGHSVSIIVPKRVGENKTKPNSFFHDVFRINSLYLPAWPYSTLKKISFPIDLGKKIKSIIKKGNFDIVHVHAQQYPICWFAIQSAHQLDVPCVLTSHGMWALDPNVMARKTRLEYYFNKFVYSRLLKKTDAVIGLTDQITNFAKNMGRKETKFFTIPNGANTAIYKDNIQRKKEYREDLHLRQDSIVILFLGRLEQVKGIVEFANAAKNIVKNKQIEVLIVGEGTLEDKAKLILKGIDRIHFVPWQSMNVVHKFYIASDIYVLPSKFEGLPLTIIEAMNAGMHIVYTPVGGIPEIIDAYSRKTLLKIPTSNEIQNVLNELISRYSSSEGIDEALEYARKFDWGKLSQDIIKVYEKCLIPKK